MQSVYNLSQASHLYYSLAIILHMMGRVVIARPKWVSSSREEITQKDSRGPAQDVMHEKITAGPKAHASMLTIGFSGERGWLITGDYSGCVHGSKSLVCLKVNLS